MNMERKGFDISEEDMTQTIYENYLGIFEMLEMWVASQPRANRVIPLIEKKNIPKERILELIQDGNGKVLRLFEIDKPLGRGIKGDLSRFQDH